MLKRSWTVWLSGVAGILLVGMLAFAACSPPNDVSTGGNTDQSCKAGEACNKACPGGGCTQNCPSGATCNFTCATGNCKQTCADDAKSCQVSCAGGNCTQACGDVGICTCAPGNCE